MEIRLNKFFYTFAYKQQTTTQSVLSIYCTAPQQSEGEMGASQSLTYKWKIDRLTSKISFTARWLRYLP